MLLIPANYMITFFCRSDYTDCSHNMKENMIICMCAYIVARQYPQYPVITTHILLHSISYSEAQPSIPYNIYVSVGLSTFNLQIGLPSWYTDMPFSRIQDGWTALICASVKGMEECVRILLEKGAQANIQGKVSSFRPVQCLLLMSVHHVLERFISGL